MAGRARARGGACRERRLFRDGQGARQAQAQGRAHEYRGSRPSGTAGKILTGGDGILPYRFARSAAPPIVVARNCGLSTAELRIHWPVGSLPTMRLALWPSLLAKSRTLDKPSFLVASLMSSSLPVRKNHPGPTPYFSA